MIKRNSGTDIGVNKSSWLLYDKGRCNSKSHTARHWKMDLVSETHSFLVGSLNVIYYYGKRTGDFVHGLFLVVFLFSLKPTWPFAVCISLTHMYAFFYSVISGGVNSWNWFCLGNLISDRNSRLLERKANATSIFGKLFCTEVTGLVKPLVWWLISTSIRKNHKTKLDKNI